MDSEINIWLHNNPYKDKKRAKAHSDAILQQLLQKALNTSNHITIYKGVNGKPFVNHPVFFSHSNSRQLHAYVIHQDFDIGLDVELKKTNRDFLKTAQRYFHPKEYEDLFLVGEAARLETFYQQWTRKEAWCKLEGGNLWSYLNKLPSADAKIHFCETHVVKGFAVAIASPEIINKIRINTIGKG
ncbi:MAG: 4'-phosphopantetheinyl transferase superfamily protein [Marinicella sp.]